MTPEEIKEALEKSGYLFEQKVASVIEQLGYHTTTNRAYLDTEENKSREIDVVAHKRVFKIENPIPVSGICYLNCECKNSSTPYVFINRKKGTLDEYWEPDGIFLVHKDYQKKIDTNRHQLLNAFYYLQLENEHFATRSEIKSVQLCKIIHNNKKIEAQHTGIIESFIYPLIKSKRIWEGQTPKSSEEHKYCKFFFNLAVVNSELYTINSEEETAMPIQTKYVPFIREVRTKDIQGYFLITFVTFEYLKEFIENEIEVFCKKVYEKYTERPELLLNPSLADLL